MTELCPTCKLNDAVYDEHRVRDCSDPWHADAHLRRNPAQDFAEAQEKLRIDRVELARREELAKLGRPRHRAIDENSTAMRMRAQQARDIFEKDLSVFIKRWAPDNLWDRDNFQRDLMMLFRDAMEHKSNTFGLHIERTENTLHHLSMISTSPLQAIYETEAHRQTREERQRALEAIRQNMTSKPKKED